jgi:acyl carrier protein
MSSEEISARVLAFVRERFLDGDRAGELDESTPLLEWGVLNSMNTVLLLNFIRDEFGVAVPHSEVNGQNFRDVTAITETVAAQSAA